MFKEAAYNRPRLYICPARIGGGSASKVTLFVITKLALQLVLKTRVTCVKGYHSVESIDDTNFARRSTAGDRDPPCTQSGEDTWSVTLPSLPALGVPGPVQQAMGGDPPTLTRVSQSSDGVPSLPAYRKRTAPPAAASSRSDVRPQSEPVEAAPSRHTYNVPLTSMREPPPRLHAPST